MNDDAQKHRRDRLASLAQKFENNAEFGRKLGYKDGAYIWQLITERRPINEKFIAKVYKKLPSYQGWFDAQPPEPARDAAPSVGASAQESKKGYAPADASEQIAFHIERIGDFLLDVDEIKRGAIAELLANAARRPEQAAEIAQHVTALLASQGKRAA